MKGHEKENKITKRNNERNEIEESDVKEKTKEIKNRIKRKIYDRNNK